jgi:hypothetical protein
MTPKPIQRVDENKSHWRVDGRKLKRPLADCPICFGKGTARGYITSPCGAIVYTTNAHLPCPCTYEKRRDNPKLLP